MQNRLTLRQLTIVIYSINAFYSCWDLLYFSVCCLVLKFLLPDFYFILFTLELKTCFQFFIIEFKAKYMTLGFRYSVKIIDIDTSS